MTNKTYVITGATSGIGKALLQNLAKENYVFAGYRNDKYIEELKSYSDKVFPFYIDYSKPETIGEAFLFINEKTNKIDTLVNIAGCVVAGPIEKVSVQELRRQFDVNAFGHLEFAQKLLDKLNGGRIINVSSMASYGVFPFVAPYCASKRCLDMLFNSILIETKKDIKIISIKPGVIATPLWDKSVDENSKYLKNCDGFEKEMEFMIENAKRNGRKGLGVEEVVKVILKADSEKKPKLTYTVGKDAYIAMILSKLPQELQNKIIKFGMKFKFNQ